MAKMFQFTCALVGKQKVFLSPAQASPLLGFLGDLEYERLANKVQKDCQVLPAIPGMIFQEKSSAYFDQWTL